MGRVKEYDLDFVLDAAMMTFWKNGYEGTSIRDLAKSSKLTTRSMYNAFPDKDKFFEAALDRYHEKVLTPIIHLLESMRGFESLQRFAAVLSKEATPDGCLFYNTAASRHLVSKASVQKVEKYVGRLRSTVKDKLKEARDDGRFRGDVDLRANQIVMGVLGFTMAMKAGIPKKEAGDVLTQIVADLERE